MNNTLRFDFEVDEQSHTVRVAREFAAPLNRVWAAWTTATLLDQWWAPKPYKAKTKALDLRPGGHWLYAMTAPDGTEHWSRAVYETVTPETAIAYDDAFCDASGNVTDELPGSHWDVRFETRHEHTIVHIEIAHQSATALRTILQMGFREGFAMGLSNLDALLER